MKLDIRKEGKDAIVEPTMIDGVEVTVHGVANVTYEEARAYLRQIKQDIGRTDRISQMAISMGQHDKIQLDYTVTPQKFQRIRRITGYLTGGVERWNNAKKNEEKDRVKHSLDFDFSH